MGRVRMRLTRRSFLGALVGATFGILGALYGVSSDVEPMYRESITQEACEAPFTRYYELAGAQVRTSFRIVGLGAVV